MTAAIEPFLGSGSSLIAVDKTGRVCRVELDPLYVDVIMWRYESATDNRAILPGRRSRRWHRKGAGTGGSLGSPFSIFNGSSWEALPGVDAFGHLGSLPARSGLNGVSWVQSGSVETAIGQRLARATESKGAIRWTRLSCRSFAANAVRLELHALAYNLGNFLRTLATPEPIQEWSLTSLKEKLIKIGAKVVSHGRYVAFQMAEVAIPRNLFADVLRLIAELRPPPVTSTA